MNLLVGDIGGTHTRLAVYARSGFAGVAVLQNDSSPDFYTLLTGYCARLPATLRPQRARFAVAAPVTTQSVRLTNRDWHLDSEQLREILGLQSVQLINDFAALVLGIHQLEPGGFRQIGGGYADPRAALVAIGPGTGFGMAGLVPCEDHWAVVSSEGGHATLATLNGRELEILGRMRHKDDPVSVEEVLSGPGLLNLYKAIAALDGITVEAQTQEAVTQLARNGNQLALETLDMFFRFLGRTAGDAALAFNARGGAYLAGGILPELRPELERSRFRDAFENKGKYTDYVVAIPTFLITDPLVALRGLASMP
ncbi:MAG TPA: glucokinase [Gammaproteobacteria bacterium]|nr:glucokinase [Gammaproteobacteria bacterium]